MDKKISFSLDNQGKNKEFIVSGIYDVEKWLDFKIADLFDKDIKQNQKNYFEKLILSSPLTLILVHDNFYEANKNNFIDKNKLYYGSYLKNPLNIGESLESYSYIDLVDKVNVYNILKDTTFENDDLNIAITPEILNNLLDEFWLNNPNLLEKFNEGTNNYYNQFYIGNYYDDEKKETIKLNDEERINSWYHVYEFLKENNSLNLFNNLNLIQKNTSNQKKINISGIVFYHDDVIFLNKQNYKLFVDKNNNLYEKYQSNYEIDYNSKYAGVLINASKDHNTLLKLCKNNWKISNDDSVYKLISPIMESLETTDNFISSTSTIFLWIGIVLTFFATLLLFNFISVSISNKNKEIGILRALGARGIDVFKIFIIESLLIVGICFLISVLGGHVICNIINNNLANMLNKVSLLVFGIPSIILILGLSIIVALISTFTPILLISIKKPVESIKSI